MVFPLGTVVNVAAIIAGGMVGLLMGARMPERVRSIVFTGLSLCVLVIGMQMALGTKNPLIMVFSVVLGCITGELLRLEDGLAKLGDWLKAKFSSNDARFTEGFVTASVIFCIGSMAILGSFDEGLRGDHTILFTKAILDGFASIAFAAALGLGVVFSAIPVFIYQGSLTELATVLQPWLTDAMMAELTATGGVLIIGIAINIMELRRIPLTNFLPALVYAPLLVLLTT